MRADAEAIDYRLAEADGLIGEHRHLLTGVAETVERFAYAGVERRVVEVVLAVVLEEELERFLHLWLRRFGTQGTADEHGCAVAHVGVDALVLERGLAHVGTSGVDGVRQIQFRIDQGAVEIEDQQVHRLRGA
jgi:hypothetical protein